MVKNPPAVQETWVQPLSWEDPLQKEMIINSSILAWEISQTAETSGLSPYGHKRVGDDFATKQK